MPVNNPRLTRAALRLDDTLNQLERAIVDRNAIQKSMAQTWKQILPIMQRLDQRWSLATHAQFRKLNAKHTALQKTLAKAQIACTEARQDFHDTRDAYDAARMADAHTETEKMARNDRLYRRQGALCRALDHALDQLKTRASNDSPDQTYDVLDGAYDYIPLDAPRFLSLLIHLDQLLGADSDYQGDDHQYRPVTFLEVGCGPGRNLLLARESNLFLWRDITGFDINPVQVALGQKAFGLQTEMHVADAMHFDYSPFDVVFSFRPFADDTMQRALESHIVGSMRPNAYLLAPLSSDLSLYPDLVPSGVSPDIWKKTG